MDLSLQVRNLKKAAYKCWIYFNLIINFKVRVNNNLIIGNSSINSVAGKFDKLKIMVYCKVDKRVWGGTKIDSSFQNQ